MTNGTPVEDLVDQVTEVGRSALKLALSDPVFIEALWLLVRMPQAAASDSYPRNLGELGMECKAPTSLPDVLVSYDRALEKVQRRRHEGVTDLGEIARRAGLSALGAEVGEVLPAPSSPADVQASIARLGGNGKFASLAHRFYAGFVERVIHYYVDRNLHNMVGAGRVARSVHDLRAFNDSIRRYCDEAALIMRIFARDWREKKIHCKDGKQISKDDVRGFSAHAVEKIRIELAYRRGER